MSDVRKQVEAVVLDAIRRGEYIGQVMERRNYTDEHIDELERQHAGNATGVIMSIMSKNPMWVYEKKMKEES